MPVAGAPETIADLLEMEQDEVPDMANVVKIVIAMQCKTTEKLDLVEVPARKIKTAHLPLSFAADKQTGSTIHIVDIFMDETDDFDRDEVTSKLTQQTWADLPGCLKPKEAIVNKYVMNLNIIPQPSHGHVLNGKCTVVKHFVFESQTPLALAKKLVQGTGFLLNY